MMTNKVNFYAKKLKLKYTSNILYMKMINQKKWWLVVSHQWPLNRCTTDFLTKAAKPMSALIFYGWIRIFVSNPIDLSFIWRLKMWQGWMRNHSNLHFVREMFMISSVFYLFSFLQFRYSRPFFKIFVKVQDRTKKFSPPVGVGWKSVGGKLVWTD